MVFFCPCWQEKILTEKTLAIFVLEMVNRELMGATVPFCTISVV